MSSGEVVSCSDESLKIKTKRRKASAITKEIEKMTIYYKDGSTLICSYIVLCGSNVIADDIYELNAEDIESIAD